MSKPPVARGHRHASPVATASPTLRSIFGVADARGIKVKDFAATARRHPYQIACYRVGRHEPGILTVEELAAAAGLRIAVIDSEGNEV